MLQSSDYAFRIRDSRIEVRCAYHPFEIHTGIFRIAGSTKLEVSSAQAQLAGIPVMVIERSSWSCARIRLPLVTTS